MFAAVAYADDISNNLDAYHRCGRRGHAAERRRCRRHHAALPSVPEQGDGKQRLQPNGARRAVLVRRVEQYGGRDGEPVVGHVHELRRHEDADGHPVAQGTATVNFSQTSNNTGGTFDLDTATFTVNVRLHRRTRLHRSQVSGRRAAAPTTTRAPFRRRRCDVTDAEDGNTRFAGNAQRVQRPYAVGRHRRQTASCSYTDGGGLTARASETYSIVDPSAPTIGYTLNPGRRTGRTAGTRATSALDLDRERVAVARTRFRRRAASIRTSRADQAATTYSCSATSAGGSRPGQRDDQARWQRPVGRVHERRPAANAAGWYNTDVTATFTATDNLSGFSAVALLTQDGTSADERRGRGRHCRQPGIH